MHRKDTADREKRDAGRRYGVVSVLVLVLASALVFILFRSLYRSSRENLLNIWDNNILQMARSAEYYMGRPSDAVEFTAMEVESMVAQGRSNEEIGQFLVAETGIFAPLVDSNTTGVYGYIRGEYLDASGWVPGPDYEPTQRPWYQAALAAEGRVTLVAPYRNLQTGTLMISVSKLLSDGESVVSMDMFLDGLQASVASLAADDSVSTAFVMDRGGVVVAHADPGESGKNYLAQGGSYEAWLVRQVLDLGSGRFTLEGLGDREIVYVEEVNEHWLAVLIVKEAQLTESVRSLYAALAVVLAAAVLSWYSIYRFIQRKYREAEQLDREVNAVADIYEAMSLIDLKTDCMTILRCNDYLEDLLQGDLTDYSKRITRLAGTIASEQSRELLARFMDPCTYEERLQNARSISHDFLDFRGLWARIQLILVDRDEDGRLWHIIWAIESIDEERKQQEYLRKLAETDSLCRVRNRFSGERAVREALARGREGLFLLMDVDDFKSINDTLGHDMGDRVIIALADCLRRLYRDDDIVFRLGGDEFAVFLPGARPESAAAQVTRLQWELAGVMIPELRRRSLTVSVGTAYYPTGEGDSFEALYQRADQRMYEEKRQKKTAPGR